MAVAAEVVVVVVVIVLSPLTTTRPQDSLTRLPHSSRKGRRKGIRWKRRRGESG